MDETDPSITVEGSFSSCGAIGVESDIVLKQQVQTNKKRSEIRHPTRVETSQIRDLKTGPGKCKKHYHNSSYEEMKINWHLRDKDQSEDEYLRREIKSDQKYPHPT